MQKDTPCRASLLNQEARGILRQIAVEAVTGTAPRKDEMLGTLLQSLRVATRKMRRGSEAHKAALYIHGLLTGREDFEEWLCRTLNEEADVAITAQEDMVRATRLCALDTATTLRPSPDLQEIENLWAEGATPSTLEAIVVSSALLLVPKDYNNSDAFLEKVSLFLIRFADLAVSTTGMAELQMRRPTELM